MAKQYQWQIALNGDGPLAAGVLSGDTSVHTTSDASGIAIAEFYYIDSNNVCGGPDDWWEHNFSEVVLTVRTVWMAEFDNRNNLTITLNTFIDKIERDIVEGNPEQCDTSGRNMDAYQKKSDWEQGLPSKWHGHDGSIDTAKVIATDVQIGTYSFTIPPSAGTSEYDYSMFFFNKNDNPQYHTQGDRLELGIKFTNIMPPDYRPGAIRDNGNVWQSHNRNNGEAHILTADNGSWREMRTDSGLVASGNPPSIRINSKWMNQRQLGKE